MARHQFDGRFVTHCDGFGGDIASDEFFGAPGLTELLGTGFCPECRPGGLRDFADMLLVSPLLTEPGKATVRDWLYMQADEDVVGFVALLRGQIDSACEITERGLN